MQRGIAASGYLFDRVSLPWEGEAAKKRLYRWIPGGMLFRKVDDANDRRRLLAVLLVGESPKGGIQSGKVTLDRTFFSNLFAYGGIPVIGIVLTQFPAIGHLFGGWLDPLLRVIGGGG